MDGFEVNKILGALLGTALLVIGIGNIAEAIYDVEPLAKSAYPVEVAEATPGGAPAAPKVVDLGTLLAAADPARGERLARSTCTACHTLDKGQPAATGPNLYGIVGSPTAHMGAAFNYSSAMKGLGGDWTFDRLWQFLADPRGFLKGTAMSFVGLPREKDRADVIAFLTKNSDSPVPFPAPAAAAPASPPADQQGAATPSAPPAAEGTQTAGAATGPAPAQGMAPAAAPSATPAATPPTPAPK